MAPSLALETAGLYLAKSLTLTSQVSGLQPLHDSSFPKAKNQKETQPTNKQENYREQGWEWRACLLMCTVWFCLVFLLGLSFWFCLFVFFFWDFNLERSGHYRLGTALHALPVTVPGPGVMTNCCAHAASGQATGKCSPQRHLCPIRNGTAAIILKLRPSPTLCASPAVRDEYTVLALKTRWFTRAACGKVLKKALYTLSIYHEDLACSKLC